MDISKNFKLEEVTASATASAKGIKNVPGTQEVINPSSFEFARRKAYPLK